MSIEKLDARLERVEDSLDKLEQTNERIAESLERLVVLETRHDETRGTLSRIESMLGALDDRVSEVEHEIPWLQRIANAVAIAVGLIVIAAAGIVWAKVT